MCRLNCKHISNWLGIFLILRYFETEAADTTDITRLRQYLLNAYDKTKLPNQNRQIGFTINPWLKAFEVDEDLSILTLHLWCVMTWNDDNLKWDPKGYGNLTAVLFASHELWKPNIIFFNTFAQSDVNHFGNTHFHVKSTGLVTWIPPTRFQIGFQEDLRLWPYDSQSCDAIIRSYTHGRRRFNLTIPVNQTEVRGTKDVENREWRIISTTMKRESVTWFGLDYPDIRFTVNMQRRCATHTSAVIIPGLAIATAILISFWLRPGSVERLAMIMLVIIINALYLNQFYVFLKTHGDRVPLVLLFYRDSLLMVTVALVWTIGLRYLATTKRTSPVPLPGFIESFLASFPSKIFCLDPRPTVGSPDTDDEGKLVTCGNPHQADWAWLAHLLDRIAFLIYLIVYIYFYFALL